MSERLDVATRKVVYEIPGQESVQQRRGLSYRGSGGERLTFDVYEPPGPGAAGPRPAVMFVMGYNDLGMQRVMGCRSMEMACYVSWGQLVAMHGMVGLTYECRQPAEDARSFVDHVRANAHTLNIDPARIGVWACSGHAPNAVSLLMDTPDLPAAALCYPYLLDLDGEAGVTEAAAQYRFVTPAAGRPVSDLPAALRWLVVRAGRDETPGLNAGLDRVVAHAIRANLGVALLNHASGPHAFDITDPGRSSRLAVQHVLTFLQASLDTVSAGAEPVA